MDKPSKPSTVLVVEDESLVNWDIADVLRDSGFNVVQAFTGEQAMAIIEKQSDIRLVFADINLPGKLDGIAIANEIQERWPHIEVLLTSAFNRERVEKLDIVRLYGRFVLKPYPPQAVARRIREIVGEAA